MQRTELLHRRLHLTYVRKYVNARVRWFIPWARRVERSPSPKAFLRPPRRSFDDGVGRGTSHPPAGCRATLARRDVFYDIMCAVTWEVEFTEEFYRWYLGLAERVQDAIGESTFASCLRRT